MKQTFDLKSFSKAIRQKRRVDLNIGVREAGKQIGISPATLSRYENDNLPEIVNYANICKWLNVSMDKFIIKSRKVNKPSGFVPISKTMNDKEFLCSKQKATVKIIN